MALLGRVVGLERAVVDRGDVSRALVGALADLSIDLPVLREGGPVLGGRPEGVQDLRLVVQSLLLENEGMRRCVPSSCAPPCRRGRPCTCTCACASPLCR